MQPIYFLLDRIHSIFASDHFYTLIFKIFLDPTTAITLQKQIINKRCNFSFFLNDYKVSMVISAAAKELRVIQLYMSMAITLVDTPFNSFTFLSAFFLISHSCHRNILFYPRVIRPIKTSITQECSTQLGTAFFNYYF